MLTNLKNTEDILLKTHAPVPVTTQKVFFQILIYKCAYILHIQYSIFFYFLHLMLCIKKIKIKDLHCLM